MMISYGYRAVQDFSCLRLRGSELSGGWIRYVAIRQSAGQAGDRSIRQWNPPSKTIKMTADKQWVIARKDMVICNINAAAYDYLKPLVALAYHAPSGSSRGVAQPGSALPWG